MTLRVLCNNYKFMLFSHPTPYNAKVHFENLQFFCDLINKYTVLATGTSMSRIAQAMQVSTNPVIKNAGLQYLGTPWPYSKSIEILI